MASTSPPSLSAVGVFGGTFDPPHLGHLILAEVTFDALKLDQVLFVPAADPPHKHKWPVTDVKHRVAMLREAIVDNPRFALSQVDISRPGPHYTVDTLRLLQEEFAGAELYFLMGGDSLRDFPSWHDPGAIIAQARLAVMQRPGENGNIDLPRLSAQLPGIEERIVFVDAPVIGISATLMRERYRAGGSIRYQVPHAVERYIVRHGLYR